MAFFRAKAGQKAGFRVLLKYFEISKAFCYYIKQINSMLNRRTATWNLFVNFAAFPHISKKRSKAENGRVSTYTFSKKYEPTRNMAHVQWNSITMLELTFASVPK